MKYLASAIPFFSLIFFATYGSSHDIKNWFEYAVCSGLVAIYVLLADRT